MIGPSTVEELQKYGLLDLAKEIAARYHLTLDELLGRDRHQYEANARRDLWVHAYALIPSFFRLARLFGRNHSTIRYAVLGRRGKRRCGEQTRVDLSGCESAGYPCGFAPYGSKLATCEMTATPLEEDETC